VQSRPDYPDEYKMFYPVSLNLDSRTVVVIGGGAVAERKVESLVEAGARVVVVSPRLTAGLRALGESGAIAIRERAYEAGDCQGAFLVISAANDPAVQQAVWREAEELGILVNTVDEPSLCNVIMPAVFRQGDLSVAVSTGGKSPALAARLREQLAETFGPEYGRLLDLLGRFRPGIRDRFSETGSRRGLHYRIVDSDVLSLLRTDGEEAAERRILEIIEQWEREGALR
jgi:siroheme synthase-like protein